MFSIPTLLLGAGLLASAVGCARRPAASPLPAASVASLAAAPRLLFFSGRLTAVAAGPARLEVLQLQTVPGELKQAPADAAGTYLLRLTQLDAAGYPLATLLLPHPLRPNVEHVGADQRTFTRTQTQVPSAEFSARLALQPAATTLRVEEILGPYLLPLTDITLSAAKP